MDETAPPLVVAKPRRQWLRRVLWTLLALVVLLAIFHRWVIFSLVQLGVNQVEKSGHMQIAYELDGNIFTTLELTKVKVRVLEPGPLKKLKLERLALHYHPWNALTQGLPALIESVEVHDLEIEIDATKPSPPRLKKKNDSSSIPFPGRVDIRGVHVKVETPTGILNVDNANLTLLPDRPGIFSIDQLTIPAFRTFDHLHAQTSYRDRNLFITDLAIAENLVVQQLQINASQIGNEQLTGHLVSQLFGGNLSADFSLTNMSSTGDMTVSLAANQIDFQQTAAFLGPTSNLSGTLDQLSLRIDGQSADLATWNGGLAAQFTKPNLGKFSFDLGSIHAVITNGKVQFSDTALLRGDEWITLSGHLQLPGKNTKANPMLANVLISANLPDFSTLLPDAIGSANLNATVEASANQINADLQSNLTAFGMNELALDSAQATVHFAKSSSTAIDWKRPWWEDTNITANIAATALKVSGYQIDTIGVAVISENEKAHIQTMEIKRGQNSVQTTGTFVFQEKPAGPLPGVLDLTLKIDGPVLQEFSIDPTNPIISGQAIGTGSIHWETAQPEAKFHLDASQLVHQGVDLGVLAIDADVSQGTARLNRMQLDLPGESFIQATGEFNLLTKDNYAGQLSARIKDLSKFQPLLGKTAGPLAGNAAIDWNGTGQLSTRQHEGRLSVFVGDAAYAGVSKIRLTTSGYYTPTQAEFPQIELSTSRGNLNTALSFSNRVLKLTNLKLTQNNSLRLAGNIAFPLDLEQIGNSEKRFPLDDPIAIDLAGKDVQLGSFFTDLGLAPPVTGTVSLDIQSKGTLRNLDAIIALKMQNIQSEKVKQVRPISGEVNVAIANQRANLSGNIREPMLQPIVLSGSVPLDLASIISTGSINPKLPIQAKATMAPSSLAFVTQYVAAIENIQGTLGFDVGLEGTLEKPAFTGGANGAIQSIRFRSASIPSVRNLNLTAAFRDNVLTLNQIHGDLAGGPFTAGGTINLTKPAEPLLDLKLQGRSILLARNDTVIVRANFDLAVKGPFTSADVTGTVGITDSRFFREIDILPINLPGRPAPAVPDKRPNLGFPDPPLRDWKFAVSIKTLDAFRITGNLANGEATVDLTLGGTGLAPTLDGMVQIFHLRASLPFSRLDIEYGNIYFSKDLPPLNPILDLRGKSKVRDYEIDAYIWGDLLKPQNLFLSQPPLTQEDILTLLATGVTQSEIAQNPQLLAGRAGFLFVQKYYNKVFKRKESFKQNSLADKLDVQIGNIDPKTGHESATARLRLSDHWQVIGDLDLTGGVRGQVRYLIRFK